jgi:tetratricopeptide (TPR) repeat protein
MTVCPACGHENPEEARFCSSCGTAFDDQARSLAAAAAERLGTAGERAHSRSDAPAAASLLGRALDLLPPESPSRPRLLCDLGLALSDQGEFWRAEAALTEAIGAADPQNEPALAQVATLRSIWVRLVTGTAHMQESYVEVKSLTRALEELGDDGALAEAYHLLGALHTWRGRCLEGEEACRRSAALALRSGNNRVASRSLTWLAIVAFWGPRPIQDALDLCARAVAAKAVATSRGTRVSSRAPSMRWRAGGTRGKP